MQNKIQTVRLAGKILQVQFGYCFTDILITTGWTDNGQTNSTEIIMFESKHCKHNISSFPVAMYSGTGSFVNDTSVIVCGGKLLNGSESETCYHSIHTNFSPMNFSLNRKNTAKASSAVKGSNLWITGGSGLTHSGYTKVCKNIYTIARSLEGNHKRLFIN